jgi:hypothetical protein
VPDVQLLPDIVPVPEPAADTMRVSTDADKLKVAVTVQLFAGIVPVYVVVPLPPHPATPTSVEPLLGVTVHKYEAPLV